MSNRSNRPILYRGEAYSHAIQKSRKMIPQEPKITFDEARANIIASIDTISERIQEIPADCKLPNECIVSLRVAAELADKSYYYPSQLLYPSSQASELQDVGSRLVQRKTIPKKSTEGIDRIFYVRTTENGLEKLKRKLNQRQASLTKAFMLDVRKISGVDLISGTEKIAGFNEEWKSGKVEVTLHPFQLDRAVALTHFRSFLIANNLEIDTLRVKQYDSEGLTFASFDASLEAVRRLGNYNPLRSVHPLTFRGLNTQDGVILQTGCPEIQAMIKRPETVVGVIDGGYTTGNTGVDQYVEVVDSVTDPADPDSAIHGSLVTSAVLFGAINGYASTDLLPNPEVRVRNFRVLSSKRTGPELYEVIDAIERIVPENNDIQVYNLSLGPGGPIEEGTVDRFTYALDLLSKRYNVLFCVAVGNDGNIDGYDRIQSPSDMVNGLAIGAYTRRNGQQLKAEYSCVGPGREGNKLKPDLLAYGGCPTDRMEVVFSSPNRTARLFGTSIATPLASLRAGSLIGRSGGIINALTARTLLIHTANRSNEGGHSCQTGHGLLPELNDIVECAEKSYTLIFEGEIDRGNYREFPIPWVKELATGKAVFNWTLAVQSSVDPNSPEDYTTSSVEVTFYPNIFKYAYRDPSSNAVKNIDLDEDPESARTLERQGWKASAYPVPESPDLQINKGQHIRNDLKWDSVDTRYVSKLARSLKSPMFHVHALARGHRRESAKVRFALVLTITAEKAEFDIYSRVVARYTQLLPIKMNIQTNVRI